MKKKLCIVCAMVCFFSLVTSQKVKASSKTEISNKKYETELENYNNEIEKLNTQYKFPYKDKNINSNLINKKNDLDQRFKKMKSDKEKLDQAFTQLDDKNNNTIDVEIPTKVKEKALKDKIEDLNTKIVDDFKGYKETNRAILETKNETELNKIKINNFRPYQVKDLKETKKNQIANFKYRKIQEKKMKEETKPIEKLRLVEPLLHYSVSIDGKTYPIVEGGQRDIKAKHQAWISYYAHLVDYKRKQVDEDSSLWLSAHGDIGNVIEDVNEITFMDDNGKTAKYIKTGLTHLIDESYFVEEDDEVWPLIDGTAGDYIIFHTFVNYEGRKLAYGFIFERK